MAAPFWGDALLMATGGIFVVSPRGNNEINMEMAKPHKYLGIVVFGAGFIALYANRRLWKIAFHAFLFFGCIYKAGYGEKFAPVIRPDSGHFCAGFVEYCA
jgi:hypothetical protein